MAESSWFQKYWWIIIIIIVVVILGGYVTQFSRMGASSNLMAYDSKGMREASYNSAVGSNYRDSYNNYAPSSNTNFAPQVEERKLVKTSNIAMQTKRGKFFEAEDRIKIVIDELDAYVLSENFQTMGQGSQTYNTNTFQLKVETAKYDSMVRQLKEIGGVVAFSESATDVTGAMVDRQVEIAAEKERLRRYELLVGNYGGLNDKIYLTDRIFEQDRRIKYLEAGLQGTVQDVAYSTISLRLQEKPPALFGVAVVGIGNLFRTLVGSLNALLYFVSAILPWLIAIVIVAAIVMWVKRKWF